MRAGSRQVPGWARETRPRGDPQLPLHESHDVHEAGGADHGLVGEDGLHGLLHTIIRLQRG